MWSELVVRFVAGGVIVSLFAVVGELFKPKTFGGIFGAAPSVALVTLALAYLKRGASDVALQSRSMLIGCAALFVYSAACVAASKRDQVPVWLGALLSWSAWIAIALVSSWALRAVGLLS